MRDTIEMAREAGLDITCDPTETPWRTFVEGWDDQLKAFEALVRADERERMYGKDIDTLLFEEHRLGFEKGSRSERETCAKLCENIERNGHWITKAEAAEAIRARGETK
jgi:hypothetical protein